MKGKQIIYALISVVFFIATGVVVYVNLSGGSGPKSGVPPIPTIGQQPAGSAAPAAPGAPSIPVVTGAGGGVPVSSAPQSLLPYGTDLNFSVLQSYNGGLIPTFQYEQVTPEQIGVTDPNQLIKPENSQE